MTGTHSPNTNEIFIQDYFKLSNYQVYFFALGSAVFNDHDVCHTWQCPDCDEVAEVGPIWYQDNGTPMCVECDQDMDYQFTEIKNG